MERKIGEIFENNGEWYQCVEGTGCYQCAFNQDAVTCLANNPHCTSRSDRKDVVFKKLEKVGEPYTHYYPSGTIIYFQRYKIFNKSYSHNTEYIMCDFNEDGIVSIGFKQNKEDMEEKKLNLKPFDLEAAKAGKPVCTRDGRKARIICFDKKDEDNIYPIVCLVQDGETESLGIFMKDGHSLVDVEETPSDLMMLPEKKEGYIIYTKEMIHPTKESAERFAQSITSKLGICKVEWEE